MPKEYKQITKDISASLAHLKAEAPDLMKGFGDLAAAATKDGVLDKKTKELIALALGVVGVVWLDGIVGLCARRVLAQQTTRLRPVCSRPGVVEQSNHLAPCAAQ